MTNNEFDVIISAIIKENISTYIPESELDYTPHNFSTRYRRKMNKLMGKPSYSLRNITPKKLITILTAAIIAACIASMSIGAVREAFIKFITEIFETHTEVQTVTDDNVPLDFTDIYEITMDMSDFELSSCIENYLSRTYIYQNEHCIINFSQYIKEYYDASVNTEGYEAETINVTSYEGIYIDMNNQNGKIVIWDNGDYVLSISVSYDSELEFSKDELKTLAESVQKAEK